jgi:hypothetical protein
VVLDQSTVIFKKGGEGSDSFKTIFD